MYTLRGEGPEEGPLFGTQNTDIVTVDMPLMSAYYEAYAEQQDQEQPSGRPGRIGRAVVSLLKKMDWIEEDSILEQASGREFAATLGLLFAINGSAAIINGINQAINGDRELLDSQKWMDWWDVGFPMFFYAARTADHEGKHYKASLLRVTGYMGHAAVAYFGGAQTYQIMKMGIGETSSSLALSGATGVANAAMFVRELRQDKDELYDDELDARNRLGLWVSITSNTAESAGGMIGAAGEALFPGHDFSAYAGMGMSAIVGTGMLAAVGYEIGHLRQLRRQYQQAARPAEVVPVDRDGHPILARDLMPDYSE